MRRFYLGGGAAKSLIMKTSTRTFITYLFAQAVFLLLVASVGSDSAWSYAIIAWAAIARITDVNEETGDVIICGPLWLIWRYKKEVEEAKSLPTDRK